MENTDFVAYPITIVADRYEGVYSGGKYLAFNLNAEDVPYGPSDADDECSEWWDHESNKYVIGKGYTPDEALQDLLDILKNGAENGY